MSVGRDDLALRRGHRELMTVVEVRVERFGCNATGAQRGHDAANLSARIFGERRAFDLAHELVKAHARQVDDGSTRVGLEVPKHEATHVGGARSD